MKYLAELLKKLGVLEDVPNRLAELAKTPGEHREDAEKALKLYNYMFAQGGIEDEYFTCTTVDFMEKSL